MQSLACWTPRASLWEALGRLAITSTLHLRAPCCRWGQAWPVHSMPICPMQFVLLNVVFQFSVLCWDSTRMQTKLEKVVRCPLMSTPDSNSIHCCGQAPSASQDSIGTAPIPAGYKTSSVWSCWACLHCPLQHSVKGDFFFQCYKRTYAFIFFKWSIS